MAIIIERTITINNDKATLDKPIYFYVGDGNITCLFTIKEKEKAARFGSIDNSSNIIQDNEDLDYANAYIYKPNKDHADTARTQIVGDKLQVEFKFDNIDEDSEAGVHKLQIHLYDSESGERNRLTIPPVDINVLMPVGYDNNAAGEALVDYSLLDRAGEEVPAFDEEGNYNKTEWIKGDIITSNKLNKIEDALYEINAADSNFVTNETLEAELDGIEEDLANKANKTHNHTANNITGLARVATTGSYNDLSNKPNIPNTSNFATKTELASKADSNHTHDYADAYHIHSDYATKAELQNIPNIPTKTSQLLNDSGYITNASIPTVPTKTSQLTNDSNFITGIPSYYVTDEELSNYNFVTELELRGNYATHDDVTDAINQAQLGGNGGDGSGEGIDLTIYAKKSELPTKTSQLTNNSGFITSAALADYASIDYVNSAIENNNNSNGGNVGDLSGYVTVDQLDIALANKAPTYHTHDYAPSIHTHDNYVTESVVDSKIAAQLGNNGDNNVDLSDYATKTDVSNAIVPINEAIDDINEGLDNYAKKADMPTKLSELTNDAKYMTSNTITRIEIVTELPETEEPGVLYIVKE